MTPLILPLYGDNAHNDRATIAHLFNGGHAYDARSGENITAPTMRDLPPGIYLLTNVVAAPIAQEVAH